ncbi:DUF262 domain-containing protein [Leptothoe kymatousa]|uniref:DUF262 domain-containing protein n=1 Tax=Leptothoe kymatousa TAU-MAC 1615 TaxID=2364775 RepID=A0ABS5Y6F8_9CYAN|nr:DUF262 domain-containing protein [Leptothoe kymatousa]MBT9313356.1 DUF262 domain-containing protein [Leptothoe kymatousa TAU-MAC 1615]
MARINLLDTRTSNFGELIGNGKTYQVPIFQRDYSWGPENWEDLWQDIVSLYEGKSTSHYMGAIVLQNHSTTDKHFTVIDGQQRLATLSILGIAVIQKIKQLVAQGIDIDDNEKRQKILRRTYLSDEDPRSLKASSKLVLNENNNDFYQSYLINFKSPKNIRSLKKSDQLLWKTFQYFSEELDKLTDIATDGFKLAEFLTDTVARKLLFIQINVDDEINAYTVFETLNARGIELSTTDLLKNYLFSLFETSTDLEAAQRQWRRIVNTVPMPKFPDFLRYYLSLSNIRVRSGQLFKIVRKDVMDAEQAFRLLDELEAYSSLFIALGDANDDFWRDLPEAQPFIREINLFRVKQAYPTLFATYEHFESDNFIKTLELISVLSFRHSIVSGWNPNELEKLYNEVAMKVATARIKTPRQVFEVLKKVYVPDEKFQQDFALLTIPTKGQKKLVRYILQKLEEDAAQRSDEMDSFSIEHILPESPNEKWYQDFSDDQIDEWVYRLGNLTLLEARLNRQIGNEHYHDKLKVYQESVYALTQDIATPDWDTEAIAKRQRRLAKRATHIWRSSFAS